MVLCLSALLTTRAAVAGTWVDEDGESLIIIEGSKVRLVDTSSFDWFEKIFEIAESGQPVFLCIGEGKKEGYGPVCVMGPVRAEVSNKGLVRNIIFDAPGSEFLYRAVERELADGQIMKISATNGNIFYGAIVHRDYKLKERAREILSRE